MRTLTPFLISMVIAGVSGMAYAQSGRHGGNYNPATETTLTGTVDSVKNMPSQGRGGGGLHLMLSTATGAIEVHVGPSSFVSSKNVAFAKGDVLTVLGSRVTLTGQEVVIAREITKGDQVLTLRDGQGFPLWSGAARPKN